MTEHDNDSPSTVHSEPRPVRITAAGHTVAQSRHALRLEETGLPPVYYLPLVDVTAEYLSPSDRQTHCPHKGTATYWHLVVAGETREDALWAYEEPLPGVAAIAGHVAFYPERVDSIEVGEAGVA